MLYTDIPADPLFLRALGWRYYCFDPDRLTALYAIAQQIPLTLSTYRDWEPPQPVTDA